jgi:hypothetical protein
MAKMVEREALEALIGKLESLDDHKYFSRPIKEVLAHQPKVLKRYLREIAHPLDFWTVRRSLRLGKYANRNAFLSDVRQIFENARTFNESGSPVYDKATELLDELDAILSEETLDFTTLRGEEASSSAVIALDSVASAPELQRISAREVRNGTPAYHLPIARTGLKRGVYVTTQEPSSLYQWEVEHSEEIINLAAQTRVPIESIALPSFARLVSPLDQAPSESFRNKRRRPLNEDDAGLFEPKAKKDITLMQMIYRKIFSDLFEAALSTPATTTVPSVANAADQEEWKPPEGCRDICAVNIPPNEFLLLFEELATASEQQRFRKTLAAGEARMTVHIAPYSEVKRILGVHAIRVAITGSPNMFHLLHEPVTAVLRGHKVTFKAVFEPVDVSRLPKDYGKTSGRKPAIVQQALQEPLSNFLDEAI